MEKTIISKNENQSKNLFKFLIPSLFGLLLFVIPLPYGKLFKLDGLSPINIGIGFLAELIKIIAADYLINIALVVILASAILSVVSKFINIEHEYIVEFTEENCIIPLSNGDNLISYIDSYLEDNW